MKGSFEPDGPLLEHVNGMSYPTYTCAFCHRGFKADKQGCHLLDCVWHCCCSETCANSTNPTLTDILQRIENLCTTPHWDMSNARNIFRGHQPRIVTVGLQLAAQVMGADTGLHADQARRHRGEPRFDLAA